MVCSHGDIASLFFYLLELEQNVRNTACRYIQNIQPGEKAKGDFHFLLKTKMVKMKRIVKQVVGIDVAQNELVVCLGRMYEDWAPELYANRTFANTAKGFSALVQWVKKLTEELTPVRYVMEATGVYHESLAYFLDRKDFEVSIVLPNKISNYARTLEVKTITDKTSSETIAKFGLERKLDKWSPPAEIFRRLRQKTRERDQLVGESTLVKNQLHAEQSEVYPSKESIARMKTRINLLKRQIAQIKEEIDALLKQDKVVEKSVELINSIPGVGTLTAVTVLAETNGFELIRSRRQLTSYAGLDVKEKKSGTSVKGKPRISKKGNRYLRKAMYMPALAAIRNSGSFKMLFTRLVSKHGLKMKAAVAVQRKMLELIYTIYKTKTAFITDYRKEEVVALLPQES
jgi:transposase